MPANPMGWAPADLGLDRPNVARMYDYLLGGSHNFGADRQVADAILSVAPEVGVAARTNRAFLRRVVRYSLDQGIRQFIDLGSGIPTVGSVHEVAQSIDSTARIVYVDFEPAALALAKVILKGNINVGVVDADICFPELVLRDPVTEQLIDLARPVAVLCIAVLHFIPGNVDLVVAPFRTAMAPGSVLAVSHATSVEPTTQTTEVQRLYQRTPTPLQPRTAGEVLALFNGLHLVPPVTEGMEAALVPVAEWRSDIDGSTCGKATTNSPFLSDFLAGVARKPHPARRPASLRE